MERYKKKELETPKDSLRFHKAPNKKILMKNN